MKKILYFNAEWCGPCKMMSSIITSLQTTLPIQKINVDTESGKTEQYGIRNVPTFVLVDEQGTAIKQISGSQTSQQLINFYNG